jgi:hypothetical protein
MEYGTKVTETLTTMGQVRVEQLQEAVQEPTFRPLKCHIKN